MAPAGNIVYLYLPLFLVLVTQTNYVNSHGRLMNPPARSAMWRFGFPNPINYNDNELFCGGYTVQQVTNHGKCGVCGDDYREPVPRLHEMGGNYGNGVIVRKYYVGQDITVRIDLTSNHHGYFQFRICSADNSTSEVTQECLDRNLLKVVKPDGTTSSKYLIGSDGRSGTFEMTVRLPRRLLCSRCVFQWTYVTGNTWGTCEDGTQEVGCGPQENFINCADVTIFPNSYRKFWLDPKLTSTSRGNPHMMYYKDFSKKNAPLTPLIIKHQVCQATPEKSNIPGMNDWCQHTCMRYPPYCPSDSCQCIEDCQAVGEFSTRRGADQWCLDECSVYPQRNCTSDRCKCW